MRRRLQFSLLGLLLLTAAIGVKLWHGPHHGSEQVSMNSNYGRYNTLFRDRISETFYDREWNGHLRGTAVIRYPCGEILLDKITYEGEMTNMWFGAGNSQPVDLYHDESVVAFIYEWYGYDDVASVAQPDWCGEWLLVTSRGRLVHYNEGSKRSARWVALERLKLKYGYRKKTLEVLDALLAELNVPVEVPMN